MNKRILILFLGIVFFEAMKSVGSPHECLTGVWTLVDALQVISFVAIPAFLGFMVGRE